ncbi:O-antigen ligase family protein [Serratia rhizosphaerae]|uniref:O-antigen ligase family protein n=1 Tax=Serratia rhizosphaerae TaxID=2597702 RepID=A0ABX6GM68_9GAMM|nr:O-antigen ligase family protein [Serratia rhizosphaerae]MEB6337822.1 O-antigen ligase family protein [Serratia rhizosphaerae]QHA87352.1 O-antigen ligase family protein [Serratia rhizosphaerae]
MLRKLSTANLAAIAFLFTIIAASTSLTDSTITRNAFYLAVFFATAAFVISKSWAISRDAALISVAVFCIGLSQAVWLWRFPASEVLETHNEYLTSATRLLCGAVLIMMLGSLHSQINHKVKVFAKGLLIFGFFYTSGIGLYLHEQTPDLRLQINTVSTITAYIYTLQSLLTVYVIHKTSWRYKYIAIAIVILLSLWIIFLTETRATLLSYPIFLLIFFCRRHHLTLKTILLSALIAIVMATAASHLFSTATARLTDIINEISNYQKGNGDTSLGSRISMWKAGIHTIIQSPGGQSTDVRFANATQYIDSHEGGNPEALRNIAYHLHNDFIEAGSLQGIAGIIALLCFFTLVFLASIRYMYTNAMLLLLILPTILIGMVDTLFIDQRFVTNLTLMLAIYLSLQPASHNPSSCGVKEDKA